MIRTLRAKHPDALIRIGAVLVILGELLALATQFRTGAMAFITFVLVGGGVMALGALIGVIGILNRGPHRGAHGGP